MGKIFYVMGKSSTGKDTIYKRLMENEELKLNPIMMYTTRPIRAGEQSGVEYFFTDEDGLEEIRKSGKLIEVRAYNTAHGVWKYFTADNGQVDLEHQNYIMIGVISSFHTTKAYYGKDKVIPIYIEVDDGERLQRALSREQLQNNPKYTEMCRRFIADNEDFSEEKIQAEGIGKRFYNRDLEECVEEIIVYIKEEMNS